MYYTYIIYSKLLEKHYCGSTQNLVNRLMEHNSGETKSIKNGCPWNLIGYLVFDTRSSAMQKERQIKSRGIKRWLVYGFDELIRDETS